MTIKVVMTTYLPTPDSKRGDYAVKAARSLKQYLRAPEPIEYVIANDGPHTDPHMARLQALLGDYAAAYGPRVGIGGSLNRALNTFVQAQDIWLYTTDDWVLTQEYDLTQAVKLIRECDYNYVRLGPPHPDTCALVKFRVGVGWWLELNPEGPGFVFATRPFLATRYFYETVGAFNENCDSYVCERNYSDRVFMVGHNLKHDMAEVVSGSLEGPWEHVGVENVGERYP